MLLTFAPKYAILQWNISKKYVKSQIYTSNISNPYNFVVLDI